MLMYFRLLRDIGTIPTKSVTFMSPVVAIVLGALYLSEAITTKVVIGCIVVLLGTALSVGLFPRYLQWLSRSETKCTKRLATWTTLRC